MGSIALCNCNKAADSNEINLERPLDDQNLTHKAMSYTFKPDIVEKENGISPKMTGNEIESTQKQAKKTHQKTLSNEYVVEIDSDKYIKLT
jgi:hypothetical protein